MVSAIAFSSLTPHATDAFEPHVLRYAEKQNVATLNPLLAIATSANLRMLSELNMANLVHVNAHGHPQPELIEMIPTPTGGGTRCGVRWSDGAPFGTDGVVYSFRVLADSTNKMSDRSPYECIARVDEPDNFSIVVQFKETYAPLVARAFAWVEFGYLPPKGPCAASLWTSDPATCSLSAHGWNGYRHTIDLIIVFFENKSNSIGRTRPARIVNQTTPSDRVAPSAE